MSSKESRFYARNQFKTSSQFNCCVDFVGEKKNVQLLSSMCYFNANWYKNSMVFFIYRP